jgi:anti-sigma B factor antagonist
MSMQDEIARPIWFASREGGLCLGGELDVESADQVRVAFAHALEASRTAEVTLDVSRVSFCGSAGLRELLVLAEAASERGGSVTLLGATPMLLRLLDVTMLADHFVIANVPST